MATTKRMPHPPKSQEAVRLLINYIINPNKTEECLYTAAVGCSIPSAAIEFQAERERWDKNSGNFAYHLEQSFAPGEVTPDVAHQCGQELAASMFGDEFQVVLGTHLDKDHLHNHFAVNAVSSVDGHKLQTDHAFLRRLRAESDRICLEHGLSVIKEPKGRGKSYAEWVTEKRDGFTWRGQIRADIDALLTKATTLKDLLELLKEQGYTIKEGKHTGLSPPGTKTNFRFYKLGAGYTEEDLADRLLHTAKSSHDVPEYYKMRSSRVYHMNGSFFKLAKSQVYRKSRFRRQYYYYLYQIRKRLRNHKNRSSPSSVNTAQIERLSEELHFLSVQKIETVSELVHYSAELTAQLKTFYQRQISLRSDLTKADTPAQMADIKKAIDSLSDQINKLRHQDYVAKRIFKRSVQNYNQKKGRAEDGNRIRSDRNCPETGVRRDGTFYKNRR